MAPTPARLKRASLTPPGTGQGTYRAPLAPGQARAACAAALLAGTLTLSACGNSEPEEPTAATSDEPSPASEPSQASPTEELGEDTDWHDDFEAGSYTDELTAEDELEVAERAEAFVTAAAQQDDEQDWWDQVEPFLTDTAIPDFNTVDPRNVEYTELDGAPEIHEAQTPNLVSVDVATNGPTMRVLLTRAATDAWLVERWEYADTAGPQDD